MITREFLDKNLKQALFGPFSLIYNDYLKLVNILHLNIQTKLYSSYTPQTLNKIFHLDTFSSNFRKKMCIFIYLFVS